MPLQYGRRSVARMANIGRRPISTPDRQGDVIRGATGGVAAQGLTERAVMTHTEKAEVTERLVARYAHLGALLVRDNEILCRLFTTMDISQDREIGDFLTSFLVA
jgi:hypothetical protein